MSTNPVYLVVAFDHPLNVVESVAERIAFGLSCQGLHAVACCLPRDAEKMARMSPDMISGIMSLGSPPLSCRVGNKRLWECTNGPVTMYFLDAIIYDMARVPAMSEYIVAAQADHRLGFASPERGYAQWLGPSLGVRWDYMPFGHFSQLNTPVEQAETQNKLCVVGTVGSELGFSPAHESLADLFARFNVGVAQRRDELTDRLFAADAKQIPALTLCEHFGWNAKEALSNLSLIIAVDSWIKRNKRIEAMKSLAGHAVDFFGFGWKELLGDIDGFRYFGQVKHQDIARLMPHYRGLLNFDPNWEAGVHDRVYTACALGAVSLTNTNEALPEAQLPSELVVTYNANKPNLGELVEAHGILDPKPRMNVPRADVLTAHSWSARAAHWITLSQGTRLFN